MTTTSTRQQLAEAYVAALNSSEALVMEARRFAVEAERIAAELRQLMAEGEVLRVDEAEVQLVRGRAQSRSVNRQAVLHHAEALEPLGLAPQERVALSWPSVANLTAAEPLLARLGIDVASLIDVPPEPALELRIREAK